MILKRILQNQLHLFDAFDYGSGVGMKSSIYLEEYILDDEKGKFQWEVYEWWGHCNCHPETCSHFEGRTWRTRRTKKYLPNETKTMKQWLEKENPPMKED